MTTAETSKRYICPKCGAVEDVFPRDWTTTICHNCGKPYKKKDAKSTTDAQVLEAKKKR